MYRYDAAIAMAAGFKVHKMVSVGYSYDFPMNNIATYTSGSHEVMVGFTFGKRKAKTEELSEKERELLDEKFAKQDSLFNALNDRMDSMQTHIDSLQEQVDSLKNLAAEGKLGGDSQMSNEQMEELKKKIENMQQQMTDSLKNMEEKLIQMKTSDSGERTKIIAREDMEFIEGSPLGDYYMVVGSFKIKDNSYNLKRQLEKKGYNVGIVYNKKRNWYYVYISQSSDTVGGLEQLYDLREQKKDEFPDAWIYILR